MKKLFSVLLSIVILLCLFSTNVSAIEPYKNTQDEIVISEITQYFSDGTSVTTTITQQVTQNETRATKTITGSKTHTAKNSDGEIMYKFKITGTYSVDVGVSATCTAVSCSASDCSNGWSLDSSTTSKSGNTASATGVFKKKTLLITTQTINVPLTLSCDSNGVLS